MHISSRLFPFLLIFLTPLLPAQSIKTPVSAADPYGIDFSEVEGNVVQIAEYRGPDLDDLSLHSLTTYEKNRMTSNVQYDTNGSPKLSATYAYSEAGLLTSITGNDTSGGLRWKYEYTYDKYNRQIEEKSISSSSNTEWRIETRFNSTGKIKEHITYNEKNDITLKETFQYNDRGFVSADIAQYPDGKLIKRIIYIYTKGGHIAQENHYDSTGFFERIGYTYTENGNIIGFSNSGKDYKINSKTTVQYGTNGKIIREKIVGKDKSVTEITYIYDNWGNWIWKYDGKSYTLRKVSYGK
jgi:hypothetical protein